MNTLVVGRDKTDTILEYLPSSFLLIDDGEIIDTLEFPRRRKVTVFDVEQHYFNPLKGIDYRRARDLAAIIYDASPQGENTLTVRNGKRALAKLLLDAKRLDRITGNKKDPFIAEALAAIDDILFSPVLKNVLCNPTNFPLKGIVLARFPRAELGDFDSFVLANLLIANYKGHVIIPDFGFYACPSHTNLIRQNHLTAGINSFEELPHKLRQHLLLIDNKIAKHCLPQDAETLALYAGHAPRSTGYRDFVATSIQ